ncbi:MULTISPECIES: hydroxysqualene dehydroxylase HpnE [unclassified Streptomyces]|uniref:hydroxysqualene dehydroxylase HpnE n=1 Tax=unclassified Streptomyces TaxID=2593676 RepID=UPI00070E99CF|nr:hydroxysqualene dehydroxylase HpnE [Streptomyces sp. Root1310]KQX78619.1 phytoene dehydrogenase [Streptomyces sp. Root1310]
MNDEQLADAAEASGPSGRTAVVVGGGLAGVTAALALADAGVRVTLLEGRPRLGGLAFSFTRGELTVDNGQHVYLRCCTAYRWFLDRIEGSALAPLQDRLDVPVVDVAAPEGRRLGRLRRDALPVPLHLGRSLATYPHLSLAERARVGRAALALKGLDLADPRLDAQDFGSWLTAHGQSARAVEALWDLVGVATLNAVAGDSSLGLAAMVFKTGLLSDPGAADIGWAHVPLGELHDRLARKALDSAGVRTEVRTRVTSLSSDDNGTWSVQVPGETLRADTVVLAVPQREAYDLLPAGALDHAERLLEIGTAPILNVHVVYDRKVLDKPFFAALGTPVQWVFDRTAASGLREGQYLALSQSAAHDEIDEPVAALRERYLPELERLLPRTRGAGVRDFFVTRERTATFAPTPGVGRLRPGARTRTPGLYLAGAWTATGWPATMESAVRSGVSAADAALSALGRPRPRRLFEFEEAA